jgi:tritrans,polycis-undecaprenyl-diphosphate synthase [geranylgeranyl-diphosphate specific]
MTFHPVKHIAIILDGNRRFAKRLMLEPWKGHVHGRDKVEKLVEWCIRKDIKELTLYTFSIQNFDRPKEEFDFLMKLIKESFDRFYDDPRIEEHHIKINVLGRYSMFPEEVRDSINKIMDKTRNNDGFVINFALAYGGREELVDAIKKIGRDIEEKKINIADIDESLIDRNLYTDSSPDIVIRTGGEFRTSNFLIWQSNYSEWFFLEKTWPEFDETDLEEVLKEYSIRERRFGR